MRRITLSFVASLAPPYFSTFSHTLDDFRGERKKLLNVKCVFRFSLQFLSETFLNLRIQRDIVINVKTSPLVYYILMKVEFSRQIFERKKKQLKFKI